MENHDEVLEAEDVFRIKPDSSTDPAGEAGWFMQRERERRGISLEAAGEACGVHPHHLTAIETGDMTNMPERPESLAMIGAYAQYLGFEPEPLLAHFAAILPKAEEIRPEPMTTHPANPGWLSSAKIIKFGRPRMPTFSLASIPGGTAGLVASSLAAIMLFAGVSYTLLPSSGAPDTTPQVAAAEEPIIDIPPASDAKIAEAPMPDVTPPADDAQTADFDIATAQEEPGSGGMDDLTKFIEQNVNGAEKPEPAQTATTEPIPEPTSQNGREFGGENAQSRLSLKAKAPVWVRVEDTQGNVVMTQMLMTGDVYRVPEREDLIVIARDGGLISYEIDGKEKGVLGPPGEILVGRPLTLKELDKKG